MEIALLTNNLHLRSVDLTDLPDVHVLLSLSETDEFNTLGMMRNSNQTKRVVEKWIAASEREEHREYTLTIRGKETNSFIGVIALKCGNEKYKNAEVWYKLHVNHWRKGYATEALIAVLDYAFTVLKLHRVEAGSAVDNIGSIRVLEKAGMVKEGRKRKVLPLKTGWSDNFEYAILDEDWPNVCLTHLRNNSDN